MAAPKGERANEQDPSDPNVVIKWNPEKRYQVIGQSTRREAANMVTSVIRVLEVL
jgi:hypothetical protein